LSRTAKSKAEGEPDRQEHRGPASFADEQDPARNHEQRPKDERGVHGLAEDRDGDRR
jgi:hypothetical protein